MNLYLISQSMNDDYDTYDSAVVAAANEKTTRFMNPGNGKKMTKREWSYSYSIWCNKPEYVNVKLIGEAAPHINEGVICSSFNAR